MRSLLTPLEHAITITRERLTVNRRIEQNIRIQEHLHSFAPRYFLRRYVSRGSDGSGGGSLNLPPHLSTNDSVPRLLNCVSTICEREVRSLLAKAFALAIASRSIVSVSFSF